MKFFACWVMALLFAPLCTADILFPAITAGIDYALVGASIADSNYVGPAVIALSECECPGILFGSVSPVDALTILNSGIHINSPYSPGGNTGAFDQLGNGDPILAANYINVVGGIDANFNWPEDIYVHDYTYDIMPVPDPYAHIPDAVYDTTPDLGIIAASGTYSPGYYSGGIQVTDISVTIILQPGDYYLDSVGQPASMKVLGGLIIGEGVTLHIVGDADTGIEINGNATIGISAPDSGPYEGIAIYQKRNPAYDCSQSCAISPRSSELTGNGNFIIDGAVYMPHNRLELDGTGNIELRRVVADRLYVYGTGEKIIGYDGTDYIPGDLNKYGSVDSDDLTLFCMQWGSELSDIYIESNLNYDTHLNLEDFAIFAGHWLEGLQ